MSNKGTIDLTIELEHLATMLKGQMTMTDFLDAGLAWLEGLAPYDLATVWLVSGPKLHVAHARGILASAKVLAHTLNLEKLPTLTRVLRDRLPRINSAHDHADGEGDIFDEVLHLSPGHSCMVVPLYVGQKTLGFISLDRNVCESYSNASMMLVETYARILSLGMLSMSHAETLTRFIERDSNGTAATSAMDGAITMLEEALAPVIQVLVAQSKAVAETSSPVLLTGETGTGKEVLAAAIHRWSPRRNRQFVKLNCAAIPEGTLESELFGHVKGAFTGADREREGRFRTANGGTLFLDEIGDLPLRLQAKLLRVLQDGIFEPVGSDRSIKVDVRIVAATNVDLGLAIKQKSFREDLFYRLNVVPLKIPPLRERLDDLRRLIEYFLRRRGAKPIPTLTPESWARAFAYEWPGNIRELENTIERAMILSHSAELDLTALIPEAAERQARVVKNETSMPSLDDEIKTHIRHALELSNGRIYGPDGAAQRLGLKPSTLQSKMKKLGLSVRRHVD